MGGLERLIAAESGGLAVACASKAAYHEAVSRYGMTGVTIGLYDMAADAGMDISSESAAAASGESASLPAGVRHLVLVGLPTAEREVGNLRSWLRPERELELVTVLPDGEGGSRSLNGNAGEFPDRRHFAEVYTMCRQRGSWMDSPDGFVRETAKAVRLSLATVRMMHEVFAELGFIAVNGVSRKVVANPPRKELSESARYRKAQEQAAVRKVAEMTTEELRSWMAACHSHA